LLFNGNSAIFRYIMTRTSYFSMRWWWDPLYSWIFIVLAHWNNSPRIDMLPHSDTLSWF
jgi:dihydrofolate reductase